ncbi:hypothetical protein CASFOL_011364 [Castilleja foliolosa]|uniref:Uncharacterized protein n=1 Tax=Castilleja foliolosa TaxID=1961234 RepID=A0ABD3DWA5_9LAMI
MVFVNGGQSERRFKLKGFDLASGCGGAMRARGGAGMEGEWAQMWLGEGVKSSFLRDKRRTPPCSIRMGGGGEEFQSMGHHVKGLEVAASSYHKVLEENRLLYNQVQDLKGSIVYNVRYVSI